MSKVATKHASRVASKVKRRTARACDRCRLKKVKCDGASRCKTCKQNDGLCTYTARRGREARSYYCQMQAVMDEAIQRLFSAYYHNTGFPGQLPPHLNHAPSTNDILKALGLMTPELDEESIDTPMGSTTTHSSSNSASKHSTSPVSDARVAQDPPRLLPSLSQDDTSSSWPSSSPDQPANLSSASAVPPANLASASAVLPANALPPPSPPLDMQAQFQRTICMSNSAPAMPTRQANQRASQVHETSATLLDIENLIDLALCAMPMNNMQQSSSTLNDMPDFGYNSSPYAPPPQLGLATDGFLAPWPGTLAAAHQDVFAVQ